MSLILSFNIPTELLLWMSFFVFGLGTIIGSFLNVYIYRFHTGKSLSGNSHCLSCGTTLQWFELFPVLSYIGIKGHCRHCNCRIPIRYFLVELLTGCLFLLTLTITPVVSELLVLWFLVSVLVVILVYDFYHFIIPDSLTITLLLGTGLLYGIEYLNGVKTLEMMSLDVVSALAGSGFFLFLWLISKGKWLGFGDVKLVFPLGLIVGGGSVFSFIVLSFWIGAIVSLLLLGFQYLKRGKSHLRLLSPGLTMKSAVPFAPFLIAGALVTFFAKINVLTFFYFTL